MKRALTLFPALAGLLLGVASATPIEMRAGNWQSNGQLAFSQDAAHPHGVMTVKGDGARLADMTFGDGTIEYDVLEDADNKGIPGIWFHQQGFEVAEHFYLRVDAGCPGSNECIQYAPVSHGNDEWDTYPEFQASAPVHATGWNHVKLVLSGQRMNVYINGEAKPSLSVARLAGETTSGGISLRSDAQYANVDITPGATEGLAPAPLVTDADRDMRFVRRWQIGPVGTIAPGADVTYAQRPSDTAPWEAIVAESKGMVNVGRHHGTARGTPDLAWLTTTVQSDRAQVKHVALGYAREAWVFVNGQPVFAGRNPYYPATVRRGQARMTMDNGSFDIPLAAGANRIDIAIDNNMPATRHWGWAFAFRFDTLDGITMAVPSSSM